MSRCVPIQSETGTYAAFHLLGKLTFLLGKVQLKVSWISWWRVHDADMVAVREVYTVKHSTFKQIKYIKESKGSTLQDTTCLANIKKNKINGSLCWYTSRTTASGVKHSVPNLVAKRVLCSQLFHCKTNGRVAIFWTHLLNLTLNGSSIKTRALFQNLLSCLTTCYEDGFYRLKNLVE